MKERRNTNAMASVYDSFMDPEGFIPDQDPLPGVSKIRHQAFEKVFNTYLDCSSISNNF